MSSFSFTLASGATFEVAESTDGTYVYNSEHVLEGIDKLIELFKNGPRNQDLMLSALEQVQELEDQAALMRVSFDPNTAVGDQLDILGEIVGESRKGRNDTDYRAIIFVRMLVNASDGTIPQLMEIAQKMVPSAVVALFEYFPATIEITMSTMGGVSLQALHAMLQLAKPAGVRLLTSYGEIIGAVDGDPLGGIIGAADGSPLGFIMGGGT